MFGKVPSRHVLGPITKVAWGAKAVMGFLDSETLPQIKSKTLM